MPDESSTRSEFHSEFNGDVHSVNQIGRVEHYHAAPVADPLREGPPLRPDWAGRARELAEFERALESGRWLSVHGPRGIGKSAVAAMLLERMRRAYPGGQLYIDLNKEDISRAMHSLLSRLYANQRQIPDTLEGLTALFQTATRNRRMLVVVDGVTRVREAEALRPAGEGSGFAVFGDVPLDDSAYEQHELGPLDPADAAEYLRRACPNLSGAVLPRLVEEFGGVPAKLRALAGLVHNKSLDSFGGIQSAVGGESVFDSLYTSLSEPARWLYRFFGALPGGEFETALTGIFVGSRDWTRDGVPAEFAELEAAQLISRLPGGWYRIERYPLRNLPVPGEAVSSDLIIPLRRQLGWHVRRAQRADEAIMGDRQRHAPDFGAAFEVRGFPGRPEAMEWFRTLHTALADSVRIAAVRGWHEETWALAEALWAYYTNAAQHREAVTCYRGALNAAESPLARAQLSALLGLCLIESSEFAEAELRLDEGLRVALAGQDSPEQGERFRALVGTLEEQFARLRHREERFKEAVGHIRRSIASAESLGRAKAVAIRLRVLAEIRLDEGDLAAAEETWQRAAAIFEAEGDGLHLAGTRLDLALLRFDSGDAAAKAAATSEVNRIVGELREQSLWQLGAETHERLADRLEGEERRMRLTMAYELYRAHEAFFDADRVKAALEIG
ncbi:ATP-binding protein [Glycomyces buryatensis]|uniref:ATP-binding protein n=1 Tax=Glycomyces buryatensis TaxID=2570927 RepID=A0A4S8QF34_9ACTN|nr:ATP-binding protein [Glycomyces buryatensis]THV41732.1 ATP-binding protein [Glycomyces buryatensis]